MTAAPHSGQVLALCVPLLALTTFVLSRADTNSQKGLEAVPAGWLLPCLALTLTTLLLSSYVDSRLAALITSCGWLLTVGTIAYAHDANDSVAGFGRQELFDALTHLLKDARQMIRAIGGAVLVELLFLRRHAFSTPAPGDRRPPRGSR